MSTRGATPIFVDTGAFYARADADDDHHEETTDFFDGIRSGDLPYRPVYTSRAVLSEFATLALYKLGHGTAVGAMNAIQESDSINVVPVERPAFESAMDRFETFGDQEISFVDHTTGVLADERGVEHVLAFDDDFRTLGFTLVPDDVAASDT